MKGPSLCRLGALAVLLLCLVGPSVAVVIGIDFGYQSFKVSMVKPGIPMDIVLNTESSRKSPQQFIFNSGEVVVGTPAEQLTTRFPERVFGYTQALLGQPWTSPLVETYKRRHPWAPIVLDTERGVPVFKLNETHTMTVEAVASMIFAYAKSTAETFGGVAVKDCVITVPVFFTQRERVAILDAAELAGLSVLSLINDNTAVGVNYGALRTIDETKEKPRRVVFYDMGHSATKVSYMEFYSTMASGSKKSKTINNLLVKGITFDRTLGGVEFELRLADLILQQFKSQANYPKSGDITNSPRAMAKLRQNSAKIKHILSANTETPVTIESLWEDVDMKGFITREAFEAACEDLFVRAAAPILRLLEETGLKSEEIDEVVMVGGGARIPRVQEELKKALGRDSLNKNINADEAAVLGAAFYGATLSKSFKVKEFTIMDITPFAVGVTFDSNVGAGSDSEDAADDTRDETEEGAEETAGAVEAKVTRLFKRNNKLPSKKAMSFSHESEFSFTVSYMDPADLPAPLSAVIGTYTVNGVEAEMEASKASRTEGEEPKVRVSFALTPSGTFEIRKAELTFNETLMIKTKKRDESWLGGLKESVKGLMGMGESENGEGTDAPLKEDDDESGEAPTTGSPVPEAGSGGDSTADVTNEATGKDEGKADDAEYELKPKQRLKKVPLKVTSTLTLALSDELKERELTTIASMNAATADKKAMAEARNKLESFIYATKDRLEEEAILAVSTEEQRLAITTVLNAAQTWLEEEANEEDGSKPYKDRHTELVGECEPLFRRADEAELRPQAVEYVRSVIERGFNSSRRWRYETMLSVISGEEPRLSTSDLDGLDRLLNETSQWLDDRVGNQSLLAPHEEPHFTSADVRTKYDALQFKLNYLGRKPKPKSSGKGELPPIPPALKPLPEDTPETNDAPVFTSLARTLGFVGTKFAHTLEAADVDGDPLTIQAEGLPEWMSLVDHGNGTADLHGTAPSSLKVNITATVSDGSLFDTMTWTILFRNSTKPAAPKKPKPTPTDKGLEDILNEIKEELASDGDATDAPAEGGGDESGENGGESGRASREEETEDSPNDEPAKEEAGAAAADGQSGGEPLDEKEEL